MPFWDRFRKKKPEEKPAATPAPSTASSTSTNKYRDPSSTSSSASSPNNNQRTHGATRPMTIGSDRVAQHRSNPMPVCRPGEGGYDSEGNPLPVLEIPQLLVQSGASREDFEPIRRLGKGSFATVLLVKSTLLERLRKERRMQQFQNSVGSHHKHSMQQQSRSVGGGGGLLGKLKEKVRSSDSSNALQPQASSPSSPTKPGYRRRNSDAGASSNLEQESSSASHRQRRSSTRKGEGGIGPEHNLFAMKIVAKKKLLDIRRVQDVFTERNVLTRSNHPYLLKLHHTFQSEHKLFFVMDCMPGGDMRQLINDFRRQRVRMPFEMVRTYAAQVTLAITHLHDNGILYRDLKPENILLDEFGSCALADFGLSKDFGEAVTPNGVTPVGSPAGTPNPPRTLNGSPLAQKRSYMRTSSFVGSPLYVAPEVLRREKYSYEVDYWSLGILIYTLMFGAEPFRGSGPRQVFELILGTEVRFPRTMTTTPETVDIVCRLLCKDPAKRLRAPEIFAHKFFAQFDWGAALDKKVVPPGFVAPVFPTEPPSTTHSRSPSYSQNQAAQYLHPDMSNPGGTTGNNGLVSSQPPVMPPAGGSERGMSDMYTPMQSLQVIRGSEQAVFENFSWANLGQAYWGEESNSSDGDVSDVHPYEEEEDDLGEHHNFYDQEEEPELTSVSDLSFVDDQSSSPGGILGSPTGGARGSAQLMPRPYSSSVPASKTSQQRQISQISTPHTPLEDRNSDSTSTLGINNRQSTRSETDGLLGGNPGSQTNFFDSPMVSGRDIGGLRQSTMSL